MKKVIMIDQDGVISDRNYKVTKNINRLINDLRSQGIIIVPNSDTPLKRLHQNIEQLLGFHPQAAIGEKGATVEFAGRVFFTKNIIGIREYRELLSNSFRKIGASVYIGDSATWIRKGIAFSPNSNLLILDDFRQQSIGLYLKCTGKSGAYFGNPDWSRKGLEIISNLALPFGLEPFNYNPKYNIAIANTSGISKSDGYRLLHQYLDPAAYFMVGDQIDDFINEPGVVHCAVSNAEKAYKDISAFVSPHAITDGLEDCLLWIQKQ